MKRLLKVSVAIKSVAGLVFAGQVILYMIIGTIFGLSSMEFSFIWQAIALASITGILHYIAFAESVIRNMRYTLRCVVFLIPLYAVLAAFALVFQWFPPRVVTWSIFTLIFLVVFGILTAAFEIYSKITGKKFNESLDAYNRKGSIQ